MLGRDTDWPHLPGTPRLVAAAYEELLAPREVGVVLETEHLCLAIRGVQVPGSRTRTSAVGGMLREDASARHGFFDAAGAGVTVVEYLTDTPTGPHRPR